MISYKIIIKKPAEKFILKNKVEGLKFYKAFIEIANDKTNLKKYDIKKLKGSKKSYRMRIGNNRAIFQIIEDKIIILVLDIGSRGDIYK